MIKSIELDAAALKAAFFGLKSAEDVASHLGVEYSVLTYLLFGRKATSRYTTFDIKKRRGGIRTIHAPCGPLKGIQQKLNRTLQAVYEPKAPVHGFAFERSVVTNAKMHVRQRFVLNIDLRDFFPSINFGRVRGMFMATPYNCNNTVATILAQICCFGQPSTLPQGAPTSPVISSMICAKLDSALRRLAVDNRCVYTRYADDITFSTNQPLFPKRIATVGASEVELSKALHNIFIQNGFAVNEDKVRVQTQYERQEVTGLTTNDFANVSRRFVRQIKSMLHAWEKFGLADAQKSFSMYDGKHRSSSVAPSFAHVVVGKLEFMSMVKGKADPVYTRLVKWGRSIDASAFARLSIAEDAVWVVRDLITQTQGTAFALKDFGWVTCAHTYEGGEVLQRDTPQTQIHSTTLIRRSKKHDVCVFETALAMKTAFPIGDPKRVQQGDIVTILGFPEWGPGKPLQITTARVTGRKPVLNITRITVDAMIIQGNSGGPVLNSRGQVIGIAAKGSHKGTNQSEVIPISVVPALLVLPDGFENDDDAFVNTGL